MARVIVALVAATACLGAVVAYAATRPPRDQRGLGEIHAVKPPAAPGGKDQGRVQGQSQGSTETTPAPRRGRLLRPQLLETPPAETAATEVQLRFNVPPRKPPVPPPASPGSTPAPPPETSTRHFQCRLDGSDWADCSSPYRLTGMVPGSHRFVVRVFNREGRVGEAVEFSWQQTQPPQSEAPTREEAAATEPSEKPQLQPQRFSIAALEEPEGLLPGFPSQPIPVRISNPNPVAIEVTSLTVAIGEAPADCGAENFALQPASASPSQPVRVPAESSVDLPTATIAAPAIQMLDLPVEQDACRNAEIPLVFSGEARG
ncbi:MAG TPA: hypothetical protein VGI73_07190 [Solirubrobacterales bacterium]